jgi:hypothetical protein
LLAQHPFERRTGRIERESAMTSDKTFRTATGQTGRDAYRYELAQIANAKRELDRRIDALAETIARELPEDATTTRQIGRRAATIDRDGMRRMLGMATGADRFTLDLMTELIVNLKPNGEPTADEPVVERVPAAVADNPAGYYRVLASEALARMTEHGEDEREAIDMAAALTPCDGVPGVNPSVDLLPDEVSVVRAIIGAIR